MAYPYGTLPTPITDATAAVPTNHSGHHSSIHTALNDLLTELGSDPGGASSVTSRLTALEAAGLTNDSVTNAILANVATATIKGRVTASTGDPEDLTGTQATTLLNTFTSSLKGLAPSSGGGTSNFLRADGTWTAPAGGGGTSLLASKSYNPGTTTPVYTTSTTFTDVDATNLVVTFTAPASGQVIVCLASNVSTPASTTLSWAVRSGGSVVTGSDCSVAYGATSGAGGVSFRCASRFLITGLTPSTSYTWTWAQARSFGSGSNCGTVYGGAAGAGNPGQALMEVWSA